MKTVSLKYHETHETSDESGGESNINYESDGLSPLKETDEEATKVKSVHVKELRNASYVLPPFTGGKRNSALFRYVCLAESV